MTITGYIYGVLDSKGASKPLTAKYSIVNTSGLIFSKETTNSEGFFSVSLDETFAFDDLFLKMEAAGYIPASFPVTDLREGEYYLLNKNNNAPIAFPAVLIAGAAYLALSNKKKKVGKITTGDIIPVAAVGVGILGFSLFKKLLEKTGVWDSADTKELNADSTNPASAWSPIYWHNKPANENWSYAITTGTAQAYAKEIYDSFGPFNDCEECVKAVIKRLRTKSNLSFLAEIFSNGYGQDLLSFLRGGIWPQDRLSDADVNELNNYIKNLPNY